MAKKRPAKKESKKAVESTAPAAPEQAPEQTAPVARVNSATRRKVDKQFDLQSQDSADRAREVQVHLLDLSKRRKSNPRPAAFIPAALVKQRFLPKPHFLCQWLSDTYGYPSSGIVQIIGDPGCGKSTKVLSDMAHIMHEFNAPSLYLACEGRDKMMGPDRMLRCMHHDPRVALNLLRNVTVDYVQSVVQLMPKLQQWAKAQRKGFGSGKDAVPGIPMDIPLLAAVDPYSRLLSAAEAEGNITWDKLGAEQAHEPGTGSNFGHSKFAHEWARWLNSFCDEYNVLLFVIHQRTENVDFSAGGSAGYNVPAWKKRLTSYRYLGGNALDGLASEVLVMTSTELVYDQIRKVTTGRRVRARMCKQSHGIGERYAQWELRMLHEHDTDTFLEPPISYAQGMCTMLRDQKLLGTTIGDEDLVSVKELGLVGLTFTQADNIIHGRAGLIERLGEELKISGYYSLVDKLLRDVSKASA